MDEIQQYFQGNLMAANVWQSKYQQPGDRTPDDMHRRMAKEFARVERQYQLKEVETWENNSIDGTKLSSYGQNRFRLTEESIYHLFKDFKYIVPQGSVMSQLGNKKIGSLSNCFVIGQPEDSYGGIFQKEEEMVQLMKRRGGVGIDISTLRPEGVSVSNAAKSSTGAVSFMHRFSNGTREVAQGGRRGALMISMDVRHPDILEFIKIKRDLSQVTGANISIKLNNEFMEAVENDEDYILRFPCDMQVYFNPVNDPYNELLSVWQCKGNKDEVVGYCKKIRAKELWDEIITSAHGYAEPGIIFVDNHHDQSPDGVYPQFKGVTTNPCGEIFMQSYDACRLICINLFSFVVNPFTPEAHFDFQKFYEVNYEAMRLSDDLIDLELEYINRIIQKIEDDPEPYSVKEREYLLWAKIRETAAASRRTGLGFTAPGDVLAALGLAYDSEAAMEMVEKIMKTKMESELDCTIDLAILRGTFEGWSFDKEMSWEGEGILYGNNSFYSNLIENFPDQAYRMAEFGRRNVSWSTVAPTGTVSILTQTTSGIEPLFQPFYIRRKKVNPGEEIRVDFVDQNGDSWQEFSILHPKFKDWIESRRVFSLMNDFAGTAIELTDAENYENIPKLDKAVERAEDLPKSVLEHFFEKSPWYNSTANDIDWTKRVQIQATIQKYISHSISSTINLPENVSTQEVSTIYLESWKQGLKGITVYRDNCRTGVLIKESSKKEVPSEEVARPEELPGDFHVAKVGKRKFGVIVGLKNDRPYEVFAFDLDNTIESDSEYSLIRGTICRNKEQEDSTKGIYFFVSDIVSVYHLETASIEPSERLLTRMVSMMLRYGATLDEVCKQAEKSEISVVSFPKALIRVLKQYITDGTKSNSTCLGCGENSLIYQEGCITCQSCGYSKCG